MKRRFVPALLSCSMVAALVLAGCAGGGASPEGKPQTSEGTSQTAPEVVPESKNKVTPDIEKFELNGWDIEITNAEVVFDEEDGYDDLVINVKATNGLDEERKFEPNLYAEQNDDFVYLGSLKDADGNLLCTSLDNVPSCKPGESCEFTLVYRIADYDAPILVTFGGYTVAVEDTLVTFNVSGMQTDEAKTVADERQAELDAQMAISSVEIDGATITVPEGWYAEASSVTTCQLAPKDGSGGYVNIATKTRTAAEERDAINGNYGGDKPMDEVTINGVTWLRVTATDKQVYLFTDSPAGGSISMSSMHFTYDEALPVFESVTLK